ncbi:MAG TPA: ABC transporter permease, partial [Flavilitoribacter sp.]|nr:ABC transporter permease [Flavilitoribacter sp.]
MQRVIFNFILAIEGISANKLRSFLTGLGIVFGVAAVIAMLAIGTGAKQSILDQMKLIGANNIVVQSKVKTGDDDDQGQQSSGSANTKNKKPYSPGLTLLDVEAIEGALPNVEKISPEIVLPTTVIQSAKQEKARCVGVTNAFFELNVMKLEKGQYFHHEHIEFGRPVCIIGKNIQTKFFPNDDPVGKQIKCGNTWLTIIGILKKRKASKESLQNLGIRDYNDDIYIPVSTSLIRFKDRAKITKDKIGNNNDDDNNNKTDDNYHQIDRFVVRVTDSKTMQATADLVARILKRRHLDVIDFEIEVPELLLEQEQKTQETFNMVLAAIAGISLLVGGIGIMNIMLASVLERIKEIGVRRSLGANQRDIILQFLFEAVFISLIGGLIGVLLGV